MEAHTGTRPIGVVSLTESVRFILVTKCIILLKGCFYLDGDQMPTVRSVETQERISYIWFEGATLELEGGS